MTFYGRKMEWFILCRILARDLKSWRVIGCLSVGTFVWLPTKTIMSRVKYWCFTLNNPTSDERDKILALDGDRQLEYLVFGNEVGDSGTPHLQGFVAFLARVRLTQLKQVISERAHFEAAKFPEKAAEYCKKDGDFIEFGTLTLTKGKRTDIDAFKDDVKLGVLTVKELRDAHSIMFAKYPQFCVQFIQDNNSVLDVDAHVLYGWQESLFQELKLPADPRKVIFCVDVIGNSGKSWFCHYTAGLLPGVQVLLPGKKADMCMMVDLDAKIIFLDATRSKQGEFIQYDFLEELKNRYIFSGKYLSVLKCLKATPHVVVMMNEQPDMNKLSMDRYHILEVSPD